MRALQGYRVVFCLLGVATMLLVLSGCGTDTDDSAPEPTLPPTVAISTPEELSSTPEATRDEDSEQEDQGGGNVITRSLRTGGSWVWSGLTWVWDRGSDGANAIWDGISGASSFLWSSVQSLPSDAWHQIQRFWRWVWGTSFGATVAHAASAVPEKVAQLNPVGFIQRLVSGVVNILKIGAMFVLLGVVFFVMYRFRVIGLLIGLVFGRSKPRSSHNRNLPQTRRPNESDDSPVQKMVIEVQHAPPSSGVPTNSVPQVPAAAYATIPGTDVAEMWTRTQIRELRALVSNPSIALLFELARQRNGGPVNYRELVRMTELDAAQVGEHFSAFFRKARAIHSDEQWPIEIVPPTDEDSSRAYFVPALYLDWWFED